MTKNDANVAIFKSHAEAEAAIKRLPQLEFDVKNFSIVEREQNEHLVIVHGSAADVIRAREMINQTHPASLEEPPRYPTKVILRDGSIACCRDHHSMLNYLATVAGNSQPPPRAR
jgi:hypothetical protein